jgi:hypothetical protein
MEYPEDLPEETIELEVAPLFGAKGEMKD